MQIKTNKTRNVIRKKTIKKNELELTEEDIMKEFPNDPALQQVHIARMIIAQKAKKKGMSLIDYIISESNKN